MKDFIKALPIPLFLGGFAIIPWVPNGNFLPGYVMISALVIGVISLFLRD